MSRAGKIVCLGRNYLEHAREMGQTELPHDWRPLVFLKPSSALCSAPSPIVLPPWSSEVHHEVELVVEVGSALCQASETEAMEAVAGYRVGLDLTARDVQAAAKKKGWPWSVAKGFDSSAPVSSMVPRGMCRGDPLSSRIWLSVNGELRQEANTASMMLGVPATLAWLSTLFTLEPGDLIFTGTPSGVGPIRSGDTIDCGVDAVGRLTMHVAGAGHAHTALPT